MSANFFFFYILIHRLEAYLSFVLSGSFSVFEPLGPRMTVLLDRNVQNLFSYQKAHELQRNYAQRNKTPGILESMWPKSV